MTADMIVDFPHHQRNTRAVHFAETAQMLVFERPNVARHELLYAKAEYAHMKLVLRQDVLAVRNSRDAVDDDTSSTLAEESVCVMGIEHLLTRARMNEVRACRARCTQTVLTEQARVRDASATSFDGWERIAFASIAQTRRAKLRARKLGKLHQESI